MTSGIEKEKYIGSVRFYKNIILAVVIIAILVPAVIALVQRSRIRTLRSEIESLSQQIQELQSPDFSADGAQYQSLYPDFYAPQELSATEVEDNTAYLTFDDGPSENTDKILDTLAQKGVKATFFVTGKTDEANLARMRRMVEEGHTIGMHTYSHNYEKIYASVEDFLADMYQIFSLVRETTGVTPTCFRFPGGSLNSYNMAVYREIMAEMLRRGFVPYDWNVSSGDASGTDYKPTQLTANVLKGSEGCNRAIILMHDSSVKVSTAAAVGDMIDGLRNMGFTFNHLTYQTKPILFGYAE